MKPAQATDDALSAALLAERYAEDAEESSAACSAPAPAAALLGERRLHSQADEAEDWSEDSEDFEEWADSSRGGWLQGDTKANGMAARLAWAL